MDFDAIAARRKKAFDERTDVNREEKRLRSSAEAIDVPEEVGDRIDTAPILAELTSIGEKVQAIANERSRRARMRADADQDFEGRDRKRAEAERLRQQAADLDSEADELNASGVALEEELKALPPLEEAPDAAAIRDRLEQAEGVNRFVDKAEQRAALVKEADAQKARAEELTKAIEEADRDVLGAIERADLPVRGLELKADQVWLRGVPFNQASDAEQLRASMALGMAANPRLRVLRIRDGSLLDDDALEVIREVAKDEGFQIWIEKVGRGEEPDSIVMENGMIKEGK